HNQNIDIQFCVKGIETIGWKPRETCTIPNGEYNSEKDVLFFKDAPDMFFQLTDNQFVIFYPNDVHAPMIGDDVIKKLVFKVKI
ncbi:YhcH/YjgK/YiaL family protein, partial [Polaribacter sp. BAL334]|uniref:YhcH/YjgK/YiaL family protein n=1 Tax=Polaribacter sp. BAL334 TaxID=1708178 RepID=UPI0018D21D67